MQKTNLFDVADGVSSWAELEACISSLASEAEREEAFEQFCKDLDYDPSGSLDMDRYIEAQKL